jgi:hypothetical protein
MPNSDIEAYVKQLETESKAIKDEVYRISWYMRGGVSAYELLHAYSYEDRSIMNGIIKDNIEATKAAKMPLV